MREKMLLELRKAFPEADIRMFRDTTLTWYVLMKRGIHRLVYKPDAEMFRGAFNREAMDSIIETIQGLQTYDVDLWYEPKEKEGEHNGRA